MAQLSHQQPWIHVYAFIALGALRKSVATSVSLNAVLKIQALLILNY